MTSTPITRAKAAMEGVTEGGWACCAHLAHDNENGCKCGYRGVIYGPDGRAICQPGHDKTPDQEGLYPEGYDRKTEVKNMRFIAASRHLIPDLIAHAERLQAELDAALTGWERSQDKQLEALEKRDAAEAALAAHKTRRNET